MISFKVSAALIVPPFFWEIIFEEYNKVFIMTPTFANREDAIQGVERAKEHRGLEWTEQHGLSPEQRIQIRSGLYYNVYPLVNIYYVYEYFYPGLFFSSNGMYFVQIFGFIPNTSANAVRFFANGSFVISYQVNDLLRNRFRMSPTSAGYTWMNRSSVEFDRQTNVLSLTTVDDNTITFDITTGNIISQTRRSPNLEVIVFIGWAILFTIIIIVMHRRRILKSKKR